MPQRKKSYGKRKKGTSLASKAKTVSSVSTAAFSALKLASTLARFVNTEIKYFDKSSGGTNVASTGTVIPLATIPHGDNASERDGMSIKPMNITLRLEAKMHNSATKTQFRLIVFKAKQLTGTPSVTDFLETANTQSPKQWSNRFRFKTLYDRHIQMNNNGSNASVYVQKVIKLYGHIQYDATDTTGLTFEDGSLWMLLIADEATNTPTAKYYSRLTYVDN